MIKNVITSLLLLCYGCWQQAWSSTYNFPGGIAEIRIPKESNNLPTVRYGLKEPAILDQGTHWRVLLGIDLDQLPGEYVVYIRQNNEDQTAVFTKFEVMHKNYLLTNEPKSHLTTLPTYDKLSDLDFSNSQPPKMPMRLPFSGTWDNQFGQLSMSEDDPASTVQNYTYSIATVNTLVKAPQAGIVSKIIQLENGTKTIVIDHGRSIYSLLHGVSNLAVDVGNGVVAGAVIANVPAKPTVGRSNSETATNNIAGSSGSTVFWQVQLNGVFVDPIILTEL